MIALFLIAPGVANLHAFRIHQLFLAIQFLGTRAGAKKRKLAPFRREIPVQLGDPLLFIEIPQARQNVAFRHAASFVNQHLDDDAFRFAPHGQLVARNDSELCRDFKLPAANKDDEKSPKGYARIPVFPERGSRGDRA